MHPGILRVLAQIPTVETPANAFMKAGIWGAAVLALATVVAYLYRDSKLEIAKRDVKIAERDTEITRLQTTHATELAELQAQRSAEYTAVQNLRVADAQAFAERMIKVNEQMVVVLGTVKNSMDGLRDGSKELKDSFAELSRDLKGSRRGA